MAYSSIVPYTCVQIDAELSDFRAAVAECFNTVHDRTSLTQALCDLWTTPSNTNHVLPCLSVRTGFDLYLRVKAFPPGSEVIMSAINIPDMVQIVRHHKLRVVPLDVSVDTAAPKVELLEALISPRTVGMVLCHLYGKRFDMTPFIDLARKHKLCVIEDIAESFCGFDMSGHPETDLALFSFGVIKFFTSFGGAIAKVRHDLDFKAMVALHRTYPVQSQAEYLKKIIKYLGVYVVLDCPRIIKPAMFLTRLAGLDHKRYVISLLRGFPSGMLERIRQQPSGALLATMLRRQKQYDQRHVYLYRVKGEYMESNLPSQVVVVGTKAMVNNYWLFPVLVENPDMMERALNSLGVDAYRGATQINLVEGDSDGERETRGKGGANSESESPLNPLYPHEAKYLMNHVLYLPVSRMTPFHTLDRILQRVQAALKFCQGDIIAPDTAVRPPWLLSKL